MIRSESLPRFSRAQRILHWTTAVLVLTAAITGMILYVGQLSALVGRRDILKNVHVYSGLAMPLPLLVAYAGRWRASIRPDVTRLARWSRSDWTWLRSRGRRAGDRVGKYNAGQKANAAFVAGMIPVMLASGGIMRWFEPFPLAWRTGATFVHDWTAIATWAVVTGHIVVALSKTGSLRAMVTGAMPRRFAREHHPRWAAEVEGTGPTERTEAPVGMPASSG